MAQRHMCPPMGALRHSFAVDASIASRRFSKTFSSSTRRLEDGPSEAPSTPANPDSRRARSASALSQLTRLQNQRSGGLARGNFPSGQAARRTPPREGVPYDSTSSGASGEASGASDTRPTTPRFAKFSARPTTTHGSAPPEGQMARAPSKLNITRNANAGGPRGPNRGPNLGGRSAGKGGPRGDKGQSGRDQGPKKREKKGGGPVMQAQLMADVDPSLTLSDGMVKHLYRLQRKEWDRVPYEPKYAPNSFAAQELIHEGRELFKGEAPPVKIWGKLERTIGVVGMFGAEAQLKVRRVADGDEAAFGTEYEVDEQAELEGEEGQKDQKDMAAV
ncbi:hypothetical protein CC86DRAFT_283212 [Ophiobolus disseminans]|uniref:Uncharacterized protein n=1 Tax=Ophiobolus disseminans TaxID=1469910 RepID=A0A6A7AFT8_9PLEO|nr:hypothetical protein CC86DRAFT_283212 [Ophiobolus disseminans]